MKIMNGPEAEVRIGNCLPLENIPVGTQIHNIELNYIREKADSLYAPLETARSLWQKKESTRPYVFLQAK